MSENIEFLGFNCEKFWDLGVKMQGGGLPRFPFVTAHARPQAAQALAVR